MREQKLSSLIGLPELKAKAMQQIRGCRRESKLIFPHTLLTGVGGTGKTEFARSIGYELGYYFREVEAIVFKTREQFQEYLLASSSSARARGLTLLLFIDEIHRLRLPIQEALYIPMKEWRITNHSGDKHIPPFTLIGATTRCDMLDPNSFVTRFLNTWELERYSETHIGLLVAQEFRRAGLRFTREAVRMIAQRCLGIPRHAVSFVKKLQFYAHQSMICLSHVQSMFGHEKIDKVGLHPIHRRYLRILRGSHHDGKYVPLGIGAIAAKMRQPEELVRGSVEPLLFEMDMVAPTPKGRVLTDSGSSFLEKI